MANARRGELRVGCSGWVYKEWRGPVYPRALPQRRWFGHYATVFDTVEINNTFYRLPTESKVEGWARQAPPGFVYSPKVGQYCTHRKKLKDPEQWLPNHLDRVERLRDHLGPNLLQLPPRWGKDLGRLAAFLEMAPDRIRWAVELRDPSWVADDTFELLERHRAALCIHDLLADHPWIRTAPFTYVRFHGPNALVHPYLGRYTGRRLRPIADRMGEWLDHGTDVYAYFNNDIGAHAVTDAAWLRDHVR